MKLTLAQIRKAILGLSLAILFFGTGFSLGQKKITLNRLEKTASSEQKTVNLDLFWQVWDRLQVKFLDRKNLDPQKMVYGAIAGMVAASGDPYTVFLPPTENKETKDDLRGDFEGVGIQIGYNKDKLISVIAPLSGTPAEAAGLKPADIILKIVDEVQKVNKETYGLSLPEAVKLIRGPRGSQVKLTIQRGEVKKPFEVTLKRDTIVVKSVEVRFTKNVAVLKLSRFRERTYDEWQEAVNQIKNEKTKNKNFKGVILDLRNNPGGFLQGAVFVGSEFLASGVIVQQDSGADGTENFTVNRHGELLKDPLVVLINNGSASASEIVAGALKEAKRARLVGEKTFGKGTVQEAEDLPGGAGLHVTVSRWLLPSGASIDKEGVKPDVEVKNDEKDLTKDLQLEKAIEILLQ